MLTGRQIRVARAALDWSAEDLARCAGVTSKTILRIEANEGLVSTTVKTLTAVRTCLEAAGIEFIGTPDDGPGIRIRSAKT